VGLNIYLYSNFRGIEPEQWESAYQESVKLLNHFPIPLMRLAKDNKNGHDCHVFTTDIFCEVGSDWDDLESNIKNIDAEQMESLGAKRKADRHTGGETEDAETAYILKQVFSQQYHFQNIEKIVSEIGRKLDKLIAKHTNRLHSIDFSRKGAKRKEEERRGEERRGENSEQKTVSREKMSVSEGWKGESLAALRL